ncbi:MAG TPA: hypothetical protein VFE02_05600 [Candidatus Acidoferrales bacterium]|nr:hypothetical protein [Candidatus Acidoferrales bacterium]
MSALIFFPLVVSQVEQHIFRSRAELLLSQVQSLRLKTTPWSEVLSQLSGWSGQSRFDDQCNGSQCSIAITLIEPVYSYASQNVPFARMDDYLRWRFKLSSDRSPIFQMWLGLLRLYMILGGRPAKVIANVGMRDGVVSSKGFTVNIATYWHNIPGLYAGGWGDLALIAHIGSVPQLDSVSANYADPQLKLHPSYVINRQNGCCSLSEGYVHFTPDTDPGTVQRLMQFNLSCLTRLHPCLDQIDIIPTAWKGYASANSGN